MRERLTELGLRPEFGRELTGFSQDAEGVTAQVGDEIVRARYLVGADGGRSFVRHTLGVDFPGKTLGVRAMVADVALPSLFARLKGLRLDPSEPVRIGGWAFRGLLNLSVEWDAG